jgi:hypothetical protein
MCPFRSSLRVKTLSKPSKEQRILKDRTACMKTSSENNPIHHTQKIKAQMRQLIDHLRADVGKVTEPKAQALFETAAEVLAGMAKAFDDYEKKGEEAWRNEPVRSRSKDKTQNASSR